MVDRFAVNDLRVRVFGAPMAGGPSTPALAAAVSNAGGLGFLSAGMMSAPALADAITETRRMTSGPIGVNLFVPQPRLLVLAEIIAFAQALARAEEDYGVALGEPRRGDDDTIEKFDVICDLRPEVVSFTFGTPTKVQCQRLTDAGVSPVATVTTVDEAEMAMHCGADAVVAQGPNAGGHKASFDPRAVIDETPLDDLVAAIVAGVDCPVVAAGGLATADDVASVRRAGASAVQVGTALLLADEAGTNPVHRAALRDPQFGETVLTRAFTGRYARSLRNRYIDEHERHAIFGFPEVANMTAPIWAAALKRNDPHGLPLWAGTGYRHAKTGPAADIVRELAG